MSDEDDIEHVRHLAKWIYPQSETIEATWCGQWNHGTETAFIGQSDCEECLTKAKEYGAAAAQHLAGVRYARKRGVKWP